MSRSMDIAGHGHRPGERGIRQSGDRRRAAVPAIPPRTLAPGADRLSSPRPWFTEPGCSTNAHAAGGSTAARELRGDRGRDRRACDAATALRRRLRSVSHLAIRVEPDRAVALTADCGGLFSPPVRAPLRRARRGPPTGGSAPRAGNRILTTYRHLSLGTMAVDILPEIDRPGAGDRLRSLDQLRPDIIHVHDVFMLGIAARAAHRSRWRAATSSSSTTHTNTSRGSP